MIKKIEGIAINRQRSYLEAENKAHDSLVIAGFLPQGYDFKRKKICVFHVKNEHTEVYFFENWQEAAETLIQ